ncbi:MAG TPA: hypothetical protein PKD29_04805 [Rhodocyclaceae bacterium]|nr:hypothetical protein [Rhodocyclaceae bacterium]
MEFAFFDRGRLDRFFAFAAEAGIPVRVIEAEEGVYLAETPDDLSDDLFGRLEELYQDLLQEQSAAAVAEGLAARRVAGVPVRMPDGSTRTVRLDPDLANRLLAHFDVAEINALVTAVAHSIAAPDEPRLCREPADGE